MVNCTYLLAIIVIHLENAIIAINPNYADGNDSELMDLVNVLMNLYDLAIIRVGD